MCRLSAFFGAPICAADLVTRPSRSIITQSFDARERMTGDASTPGYLNGDGFGLGWYSPNPDDITPCVYRQARPAWNDPNLGSIAEKVYTPVLFAHVRAASPGLDVSETTCHPFRFGRYLWMHNGGLGDFVKVRRHILPLLTECAFDFAITHGSSDTALCFAIFLSLIDDKMAPATPEMLRKCLERTIQIIEEALREVNATETSLLNFVVSDGESLVASRYVISLTNPNAKAASLYYASGNSYEPDGTAPGNFAMMHTDRRPSLAIVSSEPLTENRADWVHVPRNFSIVITNSMNILIAPLNAESSSKISRILVNLSATKVPDGKALVRTSNSNIRTKLSLESSFFEGTKSFSIFADAPRSSSVKQRGEAALYPPPSPHSPYLTVASTVRSTISLPEKSVLCFALMGSLLFSGTDDGFVHVWDMEDDIQYQPLDTGSAAVLALLADDESGVLVTATSASTVTVFKRIRNARFEQVMTLYCEGKGDTLALVKVGKRVFAGFSDTNIRCMIQDIHARFDGSCEQSDDGLTYSSLSTGSRKVVRSESIDEFPRGSTSVNHIGYVFAMASCLQDKYICTGCGDGILRVWRIDDEVCVQKREDHGGAILALATYEIRQGTMLFSGSRDCSVKVWVWDGENGFMCKRTLRKHKDEVVLLTVSGDNLISGSADGTVCVWCVDTLALRCQYKDQSLKAGAVSSDYGWLFTASDGGAIQVRDILSRDTSFAAVKSAAPVKKGVQSGLKLPDLIPLPQANGEVTKQNHLNSQTKKHAPDSGLSSNAGTCKVLDAVVSEIEEESDDVETLIPGLQNELVLAPPMSPLISDQNCLKKRLSSLLDDTGSVSMARRGEQPEEISDQGLLDTDASVSSDGRYLSDRALERRLMQDALAKFVSFPTVSGTEEYKESCWQGARYIGSFLEGLGASVKFVSLNPFESPRESSDSLSSQLLWRDSRSSVLVGSNPIILARFASTNRSARTIVFYAHYDVMPADKTQWKTDPWSLTALDGYLYGRGSTDNKGPLIAIIFAIKKLLEQSADDIGINIVLVVQGEGEVANAGFKECIQSHRHWFENTSLILTSNSTWLGEQRPCITYGFRGVIELLVSVTGGNRNLHSGVDGGAVLEPMNDLITILGTLVDAGGVVCIPGFYDDVRPLTDADRLLLKQVEFNLEDYQNGTGIKRFTSCNGIELLESRWRRPSVSITSIDSSNVSGFYSIVPRQASAKISVRFVPDQNPAKLRQAIATHLEFELRKRRSPNLLTVDCVNSGDWWLEDPSNKHFQIAAKAVKKVWGTEPQYVCEGGSMPLFSFLAKTLDAPLVQIPLGQSSDGAHLPNERMRSMNFFRGKEVVQSIIKSFAETRM